MFGLKKFARDERGNTIQSVSLMAGAVAIASLAGAHFMDRAVQDGNMPNIAFSGFDAANRFARNTSNAPRPTQSGSVGQATVDYTPTGSTPNNLAQPIILDPCTGIRK